MELSFKNRVQVVARARKSKSDLVCSETKIDPTFFDDVVSLCER